MKVINMWGGPGSGKSTTAAGLFFLMKTAGLRCELVTEYAKELTYAELWDLRAHQWNVFSEQARRQRWLRGKVDFIITDAPLLLNIHYATGRFANPEFFEQVYGEFYSYENLNIFVRRVKPYQAYGRDQTEEQAKEIDAQLKELVLTTGQRVGNVAGDERAPQTIMNYLKRKEFI